MEISQNRYRRRRRGEYFGKATKDDEIWQKLVAELALKSRNEMSESEIEAICSAYKELKDLGYNHTVKDETLEIKYLREWKENVEKYGISQAYIDNVTTAYYNVSYEGAAWSAIAEFGAQTWQLPALILAATDDTKWTDDLKKLDE